MKMPTTAASSRTRTQAKAPARKTTPKPTAKARTASAKPKAVTAKAGARPKAKAAPKAKSAATRGKPSGRQVAGAAETTTDHSKIQQWAESRRGTPATVKSTRSKNEAGVLRLDFPGFSGAGSLQKISWNEWFEKFDESGLAFLYQDKTKDGKQSRFFKLVKK